MAFRCKAISVAPTPEVLSVSVIKALYSKRSSLFIFFCFNSHLHVETDQTVVFLCRGPKTRSSSVNEVCVEKMWRLCVYGLFVKVLSYSEETCFCFFR